MSTCTTGGPAGGPGRGLKSINNFQKFSSQSHKSYHLLCSSSLMEEPARPLRFLTNSGGKAFIGIDHAQDATLLTMLHPHSPLFVDKVRCSKAVADLYPLLVAAGPSVRQLDSQSADCRSHPRAPALERTDHGVEGQECLRDIHEKWQLLTAQR
jgi:hypothetical protein